MSNPYVHVETLLSSVVVVQREGCTVGQALELIVEGLDAIKQEAMTFGPQPQVSAVELQPGSWVHIELMRTGAVRVETKRANVSQALKMIGALAEQLKKEAKAAEPEAGIEALIGALAEQN